MKKIILFWFIFVFVFGGIITVSAQSVDLTSQLEKISDIEIKIVNYGDKGQIDLEALELNDMVFIYNLENDIETQPLAQFIIKFNGKTFNKTFYSDEQNINAKSSDILHHYEECLKQIVDNKEEFFISVFGEEQKLVKNTREAGEWTFNPTVYSSQYEKKPYGKFVVTVKTYEQIAEGHYFTRVESTVEFVPGIAAKASGASGYKNYFIDEGGTRHNIKLKTTNLSGSYSEPRGIDYWPVNGTSSYTVTSAWGLSGTIGYSQEDKFNGNITADFQRVTSYTEDSPKLSATTVTPYKEYSWVYNTHKKGNNHEVTQHHTGNVLVEQKMDVDINKIGVFEVDNSLYMKVDRGIFYPEKTLTWGYSMANLGGYLL